MCGTIETQFVCCESSLGGKRESLRSTGGCGGEVRGRRDGGGAGGGVFEVVEVRDHTLCLRRGTREGWVRGAEGWCR